MLACVVECCISWQWFLGGIHKPRQNTQSNTCGEHSPKRCHPKVHHHYLYYHHNFTVLLLLVSPYHWWTQLRWVYGGRKGNQQNSALVITAFGNSVYRRTNINLAPQVFIPHFAHRHITLMELQTQKVHDFGVCVLNLVAHPKDWNTVVAVLNQKIMLSQDMGDSWHDITGVFSC